MNFPKITTLFLMILCFLSCENDDNTITPADPGNDSAQTDFTENFGNQITAKFLGRVVDKNNSPIHGVTIEIGNTFVTTDLFGIFSVDNASVYEKFAYITAKKEGYIIGSRALVPSIIGVNRIEIMLLKEDVIETINSGENTVVNLPNGTEVSFEGNFIKENGTPYNGQVDVILKHLSPDDENMEAMMPGMLFAQNASGSAVVLETYGMLAVELRSGSGEELQLAEGSISQLKMPLASETTNPPATIPLWHFDEEQGYWIEEGEATLQGNSYIGEVSHFSFWNYDYPYPSVNLCITLIDEAGNPLPNMSISLYSSLLNNTGTYGYTNQNGEECGLVPADEELTMTINNSTCQGDDFSTTIGPFTTDQNITITVETQNITTITGTFVSCDGENITNGYVQLFIDGVSEILPVTNGEINYSLLFCEDVTYTIKGVDITNSQVTDVISGTLTVGNSIDLGTISACTGFTDTDGDGVFDTLEDLNGDNDLTNDDTDQDGIPNYLDEDDDGDGINTADEDYDGDNDPTNDDTDEDQIPDYLDNVDVIIYSVEVFSTNCDPLIFDLNMIIAQYGTQTNMSYAFYETLADAENNTNELINSYTVPFLGFVNGSSIYIKGTNTITNATATANVYLFDNSVDTDNDGLTDCEETTGINDPDTDLVPNGTSDPNDPNDPNTQDIPRFYTRLNSEYGEAVLGFGYNLVLDIPATTEMIFSVVTQDGSAIASEDYVSVSTTVTISPGETQSSFVSFDLINDDLEEEDEVYAIVYTLISGNAQNTTLISNITILNDDATTGFLQTYSTSRCQDNGITSFYLPSFTNTYLGGNEGVVSFHGTQADANANANILPNQYTTTAIGNETIYVRIESGGQVYFATLLLNINIGPSEMQNVVVSSCDNLYGDANDGYSIFDLRTFEEQYYQANPGTDFLIRYTLSEDSSLSDQILNPWSYVNSTAYTQTIYAFIVNPSTNCVTIVPIELSVDSGC